MLMTSRRKLDERASAATLIPENIRAYDERRTDQVIADYLSCLGAEALQILAQRVGPDWAKDFELKYVLTVPAIWNERATQRTRRAFQDAMNIRDTRNITVISEPEAAAICELQQATDRIVSEGEGVMILDAGGGTVDLISYVIRQLHPLIVDEAAAGSGDVCGGATVTSRFETWLVSKIGDQQFFDDDVRTKAVEWFDIRVSHPRLKE